MLDEWAATYWSYDLLARPISRHDPRGTVGFRDAFHEPVKKALIERCLRHGPCSMAA